MLLFGSVVDTKRPSISDDRRSLCILLLLQQSTLLQDSTTSEGVSFGVVVGKSQLNGVTICFRAGKRAAYNCRYSIFAFSPLPIV